MNDIVMASNDDKPSPVKGVRVRYPLILGGEEPVHYRYSAFEQSMRLMQIVLIVVAIELFAAYCLGIFGGSGLSFALLVGALLVSLCARAVLRSSCLTLAQDRLSFPLPFSISMKGRLSRSWSDVEGVSIRTGVCKGERVEGNVLSFIFRSGGTAHLEISRIPRPDLEALVAMVRDKCQGADLSALSGVIDRSDLEHDASSAYVYRHVLRLRRANGFSMCRYLPLASGLPSQVISVNDQCYDVVSVLRQGADDALYLVNDGLGERRLLSESYLGLIDYDERAAVVDELIAHGDSFRSVSDSRHLASVLRSDAIEDRFYVLLDFVDGRPLRRLRATEKLSRRLILQFADQILELLILMHTLDPPLVHGHICPENLWLNRHGQAVLVEPGYIRQILGSKNQVVMSPAFTAPEQFRGAPSPASDIYALAMTIYFALKGSEPRAFSQISPCDGKDRPLFEVLASMTEDDRAGRLSTSQARQALRLVDGNKTEMVRGLLAGE